MRNSDYYVQAIPPNHPIFALTVEVDNHVIVYHGLSDAEKCLPQADLLLQRIEELDAQWDAFMFEMFPELGEQDARYDTMSAFEQNAHLEFTFSLFEKMVKVGEAA